MGIENIKRWHWCVIGLLVGAGYASIMLWAGEPEPEGRQMIAPVVFEEHLTRMWDPNTRSAIGRIDNFVVHAPVSIPGNGGWVTAPFLTYDIYLIERNAPAKGQPPPVKPAPKPGEKPPVLARAAKQFLFMHLQTLTEHSLVGKGAEIQKMDLYEYLDKLKAHFAADPKRYAAVAKIEYKYDWLKSPKGAYTVFPAVGLAAIGIVWPTVLGLLTGMGLGRPPSEKSDYDLSRFKDGKEKAVNAKRAVTQADVDQLAQVEAELEAKLKEGAKPRAPGQEAPAAAPAPVKALNAGPLEQAPAAAATAAKPKGFGADHGDYYPTEVHGKKKD
jgi:hypothetical protein